MRPETITDVLRKRLMKTIGARLIIGDDESGEPCLEVGYVEGEGPFNSRGIRIKIFINFLTTTELGIFGLVRKSPSPGEKINRVDFSVFVAPRKYEATLTDWIQCPIKSSGDYSAVIERIIDVVSDRMRVMNMGDYAYEEVEEKDEESES